MVENLKKMEYKNRKKEFVKFLNSTSLMKNEKNSILYLIDFLEDKEINQLASKTFMFSGPPGVGKTYISEKLIKTINVPVLFLGNYDLKGKNVKRVYSLKELVSASKKFKSGLIYIDDLGNVVKFNDMDELDCGEKKNLISLFEEVKRCKFNKALLMSLNDFSFASEAMLDRIEVEILFESPSEKNKIEFIEKYYGDFMNKRLINLMAKKTLGYNFRDIPEVIKLSYREGNKNITKNSVKKALSIYKPTSLLGYEIHNNIKTKFKDVIGNLGLKQDLGFLKTYIRKRALMKKMKIKRSNLIIFSGPPGVGKTYMAKALAGELDLPLINVNPENLFSGNRFLNIRDLISSSRRFRDCIFFIDEADKVIGRSFSEEDGPILAKIEAELDGIKKHSESIIILAVNNTSRFGEALHDRFTTFYFRFPNSEERKEFLEKKIKESQINLKNNLDYLVNITDAKSYREIEKIWNSIVFKVIENWKDVKNDNMALKKIVEDTCALSRAYEDKGYMRMLG